MPDGVAIASDLVAIVVLTYGIYFRRHRRRDMALAYVALNVGVMAVAMALSSGAVGVGLGLGLFGVLSIIRLRSSEIRQDEVAYYFISLAIGLLAGVELDRAWLSPALMATMVAIMFVADHPRWLSRYRQQIIMLDAAYTDEGELIRRLERLLCADVRHIVVTRLDLVRDTTTVDVRYRILAPDNAQGGTSRLERQVDVDVVDGKGTAP